ncbi:MAG: NADH-quinone oxidoreductase subunit NuoH [candidate division NC10 bacterium]|nr:NADH-quinone oxidoreductase subunit NuoH [candidate division NC10 bacterium]
MIFATLVERFYAALAAWGIPWIVPTLIVMVIVVSVVLAYISVAAMFMIWWERKISAHIQVRYGPMRVGGWHGWAQSIADGIKLLLKEDLIPTGADKVVFVLAPMVVFGATVAAYVTIPWAPGLIVRDLNIGILYMVSISSLVVVGIIMAGWSSNNKYATLGALRSAAQAVSYEVPLVLSLLGPVMIAGTMSMGKLVEAQSGRWFGVLPGWFVFPQIVAFLTYFTCALAECNRLPFDIPEAESELVAGFHVEYSGMRFAMFFLAEYANMFVVSAIATTLFLGGWHGPWITLPGLPLEVAHGLFGLVWFQVKCYFLIFVMMWLRWTLARLRVDQLMGFAWKVLLPISFANLIVTGLVLILGKHALLYVGGIAILLLVAILLAARPAARTVRVGERT